VQPFRLSMHAAAPGWLHSTMGYPLQCPSCDVPHAPPFQGTATVAIRPGGTADTRWPDRPGVLLRLRCRVCGVQYWWDFFASTAARYPRRTRVGRQ
jgi:hypothetical protein